MKRPIDHAKNLLFLADRDIKAFHALRDDYRWGVDAATICFHAQQAVEKSLKAVLSSKDLEIERTHDLSKLAFAIMNIPLYLPLGVEELSKLNPYAVTVRYDAEEIATITIEEAHEIMVKVRNWAGKNIIP